jgi:hypothetical protein
MTDRRVDIGSGFVLAEFHNDDGDELVGYTVSGPAAPACKSPYQGRCGGLCAIRPYEVHGRAYSVWQVEGEWPAITLTPSVQCGCGGQHGFVQGGRFVNAGGVTSSETSTVESPIAVTQPKELTVTKVMQITLGTGEVQEVPFESTSTISVRTRRQPDPGAPFVDEEQAYSDVADIVVVDAAEEPAATIEQPTVQTIGDGTEPVQQPAEETLASPEAALEHAQTLPTLEDAAAHITAALERFPDDADLKAASDEIAAALAKTD